MDGLTAALLAGGGALAERFGPTLAVAALKGTVLLALAAAATRAMRRASAASRHLVWSATVIAVLALPAIEAAAPQWTRWTLPILPATMAARLAAPVADAPVAPVAPSAGGLTVATPEVVAERVGPPSGVTAAPVPQGETLVVETPRAASPAAGAPRPVSVAAWVALVWAAGAGLVLLRLALGTVGLSRLVRRARPADDASWVMLSQRLARQLGIRRPVTLLVGRTGTVPVTWGVVYPVVLLPADADEWSEERRRAVLLHELAHVERFDALTHVLSQLALAVFWFNPLVSLAARRLRAERERACDDLVLAVGTRPADYAGDLLELVQTLGEASPAAAALAMARRSEFEGRLLAILDPAVPRVRVSRRAALVALGCALAAVLPLAGMRPAVAAVVVPGGVASSALGGPRGPRAPRAPMTPRAPVAATPAPREAAATRRAALATVGAEPALDTAAARGVAWCGTSDWATPAAVRAANTHYRADDGGRCVEILARGGVELSDDLTDVRAVAPRTVVTMTERRDGVTRRMRLDAAGRTYWVDGRVEPPAAGAAWLRGMLATGVRAGVLDVGPQIERLRRDGGVDAVLAVVARLTSDAAKRLYLDRLAAAPGLGDEDLRRVAVAASRSITSDREKATVLRAVASRGSAEPALGMAVVTGARSMASDGEKRGVLELASQPPQATLAVLTSAADAVKGMLSDSDKAAVLLRLAPRAGESAALRSAFFGAVGSMISNTDRRRVLVEVLRHHRDDSTAAAAVAAARDLVSESDRAAVLRAVAVLPAMGSPAVRGPFFGAAGAMVSESAREDVLTTVLRARPGDLASAIAAVNVASHMVSSTSKANVLLAAATHTPVMKHDSSRAALFAALKTVSSGAEYRRVMDAIIK